MRGRVLAAAIVGSLLVGAQALPSAAAGRSKGHQFRVLSVVASVPPLASVSRASISGALGHAVKSCDLASVTAATATGAAIPTTASGGKPSECAVLPLRNSEARLLLAPLGATSALGTPAGLSGRDVQSAGSSFSQGVGNTVDLKLTATGVAKLNALAAASFGRPNPRDEAAIVVDGVVYAAPAFQSPSFSGSPQITGDLTAGQARSLAAIINASRRAG